MDFISSSEARVCVWESICSSNHQQQSSVMDMEGEGLESEMGDYEKSKAIKTIKDAGLWFAYGDQSAAPQKMFRSSSPQKMILLESQEGDTFEVEESVALESQSIRDYLEENPYDRTMPFAGVTTKIMAKVVEYLKRHVDVEATSKDLEKFDAEFVKVDYATLTALSGAAFDLEIKSLFKLIIQVKRGKRPAEAPKMSSKEMIEALGGVESGNEILSGLLSVASSTTTHPQNAERLKLTRAFSSAFRSSKYVCGENTLTKKRKEELSDDSKDRRQKTATNEEEE